MSDQLLSDLTGTGEARCRPPGGDPDGSAPRVVRRSLVLHSRLHRMPHAVLTRVLERLDQGTPPDGPDGPVAVLERRLADLLGTESALFFPSGTMAQQVALRVHAERRGRRCVAFHPLSHLEVHEQHGYAAVHGLRSMLLGERHRLLTADDVAAAGDPPGAVLIELPQRDLGGLLPEWDDLVDTVNAARGRGAAVHLDGARLWEAQPYYGRPHHEIAALFDTVYVSLYKSLGGVRGAVLAGPADLLAETSVWRQRLGGGIADAWPLAAAAVVGLDDRLPRMATYWRRACELANALGGLDGVHVVPAPPQTPLFHVHLAASDSSVSEAGRLLAERTGLELFGRVRETSVPRTCAFEVTVGEEAMVITPAEVRDAVAAVVQHAQALDGINLSGR